MPKTVRLLAAIACASLMFACTKKEEVPAAAAPGSELGTDAQKFGYSIGVDLGNSLKPVSTHIDVTALKQGLDDVTAGTAPKLDETAREEIKTKVAKAMQDDQLKQREEQATKSTAEGEKYLAENAKKEGVKTTASGLQYEVLTEGAGASPTATEEVTVHYKGTLINGEEFDSSYSRGQPVSFPLGNVIEGWTEGLQLMKPGAKYRFVIPSKLAYGERGAGVKIGPNSTLIFEVELVSVGAPKAAE